MSRSGEPAPSADGAPTVQFTVAPASKIRLEWTPTAEVPAGSVGPLGAPADAPNDQAGTSGGAAGGGQDGPVAPGSRRWRRRGVVAAGVAGVVLVAGGGATAAYAYAGDVPRGTTVLGVDVGGMSRADAAAALRTALAGQSDRLGAQVSVAVDRRTVRFRPADVGLAVDVDATVAAAASGSPGPVGRLFGSRTAEPVVTVDAGRLDAVLRKGAGRLGRAGTPPAIVFDGVTPRPVYPRPGTGLDPRRSAQIVRDGWLSGRPLAVPLVEVHPATGAGDVDRLLAELARPAVAAPVVVTLDSATLTVPATAIARSLVLRADSAGRIVPRVDEKRLRTALAGQLAKVEIKPKEATVTVGGGKPRVVASTGGRQVDTAALSRDLLPVLPRRDGRQVRGAVKTVQPRTTTSDLARLGIKERVSTFTTRFTGGLSSARSQNIVRMAQEVDGAVVKPGAVFSLNGHTGPRGYAQGYKDAPVILDGKLVPGVGGGASQFTTTLFNASYYAGLEDVQHKPHSFWFSRYPPVIESTIFYPDLDFKFRNDTPYGVLIDTSYTSNTITVSMWSTRVYDSVTTRWSARRNITKPQLIHLPPGPKCIATSGIDGFTQDAWRIFRKGGKEIRREKFTWRYDAEPRYRCTTKPSPPTAR